MLYFIYLCHTLCAALHSTFPYCCQKSLNSNSYIHMYVHATLKIFRLFMFFDTYSYITFPKLSLSVLCCNATKLVAVWRRLYVASQFFDTKIAQNFPVFPSFHTLPSNTYFFLGRWLVYFLSLICVQTSHTSLGSGEFTFHLLTFVPKIT